MGKQPDGQRTDSAFQRLPGLCGKAWQCSGSRAHTPDTCWYGVGLDQANDPYHITVTVLKSHASTFWIEGKVIARLPEG